MVLTESAARRYALDPDVRLMLGVRDGDGGAFEELVARYQDRLIAVLEHLVTDRGHAEDLAQEVFLRVYRARQSYRPDAKFATWLFTIANNVASNAMRSRYRRREVNLRLRESGPDGSHSMEAVLQATTSALPTRQLDRVEIRDVVRLALESLGERQRMAVLLNKFEGMSYEDIAAAMALTTQAVKSLLSRARGNLRQLLEPYFELGQRPAPAEAAPRQEDENG